MAETEEYRIFALPKLKADSEQDWPSKYLAQKYQEFRLFSLRTSPEAFASSADSARELDIQVTIQRLSNTKALQFIAAEGEIQQIDSLSPEVFKDILRYIEWLGMIVLLGPEENSDSARPSARLDPFSQMTVQTERSESNSTSRPRDNGEETLHFHLNGMFVAPTARGRGIGKTLIEKALTVGLAQARKQHCSARFSITVNEENESAQKLYAKVGFRHTGKETYTQQPRLKEGEMVAYERVALHMEMVCI